MKMLNLGCGSTYHSSWTNVDFVATGPDVIAHNVRLGIPFPAASFDVVYHSHVLEHFSKKDGEIFIAECNRVLKPKGLLRIAIPDLEKIAQIYLEKLEECAGGKVDSALEYDWAMMELYDQVVRNVSGGEMGPFLSGLKMENRAFVQSRIGDEATQFWIHEKPSHDMSAPSVTHAHKILRSFSLRRLRQKLAALMVFLIAGKESSDSFRMGLFRNGGEIHQWMYDRYSIGKLLRDEGFLDIKICAANESDIKSFGEYSLDMKNGVVRKPDSLYVEARKP